MQNHESNRGAGARLPDPWEERSAGGEPRGSGCELVDLVGVETQVGSDAPPHGLLVLDGAGNVFRVLQRSGSLLAVGIST
jgi:hypothetical protein